jgi:hypothetical protein
MARTSFHRFIFICGLHRSGTSPLFKILREHPRVSGFRNTGVPEDEGQHLQTVFPPAKVFGGPGQFGFAAAAHLTEDSALVTSKNRHQLFEEWSRYWDLSRDCLLEKSPPNLIRTRFLQSMFPNSFFVVVTRHPIAVALATSKWTKCNTETLVKHWIHCHQLFELDRPRIRRVFTIKYEDLIRDTQRILHQICGFLDLSPMEPSPLDPDGNRRYFDTWRDMAAAHGQGPLIRQIAERYEDDVRSHGYSFLSY